MSAPLIEILNATLAEKTRRAALPEATSPTRPVIFLMGVPRSGTTLLAQLLGARLRLGYVTNVVAKFWAAPEFGIALARSISADPGGGQLDLESSHGFTTGYEGHHEFGYFWKRWFQFKETHALSRVEQDSIDIGDLRHALAQMETAWDRPLFFKNAAALPLQTAFLARALPTSIFISLRRDPIAIAASLLNARIRRTGNERDWFSIKPSQYNSLESKSVPEQIGGQVFYTQLEIDRQMAATSDERKIELNFEDLCKTPKSELEKVCDFIKLADEDVEERVVKLPTVNDRSDKAENTNFRDEVARVMQKLRSA